MLQRHFTNPVVNIAPRTHACLGEAPQSLGFLEKALASNQPNLAAIARAPELARMDADPRFVTFRQKLKLPGSTGSACNAADSISGAPHLVIVIEAEQRAKLRCGKWCAGSAGRSAKKIP
jgi:hypothetical protein